MKTRRLVATYLLLLLAGVALAQSELPQEAEPSFEVEPPLLVRDLAAQLLSENDDGVRDRAALSPDQLTAALEKAKKRAAASDRLFRSGIIAKVEAENRALEVVRLEADLANAELARANANLADTQSKFDLGQLTSDKLSEAKTIAAQASALAQKAASERDQAELQAALINLQRQKKLLALGSARKVDVSRAQDKVASLQSKK